MKHLSLLFIVFTFVLTSNAQDIIVKKDGTLVKAKVIKISSSEIEYKKFSRQDGPTYSIQIAEVLSINYEDGEKESFGSNNNSNTNHPQFIEVPVADDNTTLIDKYNRYRTISSSFKKKDKPSDGAICIIGFTENSVLSNDDIEISFKTSTAKTPLTTAYGNIHLMNRYYISIKNKTDKIIYIDLANCYRNEESTGDIYCYYDGKSVSVTHGNSSSVGVGVGTSIGGIGIGVGSASTLSSGTSTSLDKQRFISIPPRANGKLSDFVIEYVQGFECELLNTGEEFSFSRTSDPDSPGPFGSIHHSSLRLPKGYMNIGEIKSYEKETSPYVCHYSITYSTSPSFDTYSTIAQTIYIKQMLGIPQDFRNNGGIVWFSDIKKGLYGCKSRMVDYIESYDKFTICGCVLFEKK